MSYFTDFHEVNTKFLREIKTEFYGSLSFFAQLCVILYRKNNYSNVF